MSIRTQPHIQCATELEVADLYTGLVGGWADGRLGQAFDLIWSVQEDNGQDLGVFDYITDQLLRNLEEVDQHLKCMEAAHDLSN